jgi:tetratricopeptide (TPR) repeat protein
MIVLVLLALLGFSCNAHAETVKLKSGKTVQGKIVERDKKTIQLDVGLDFPITYYLDEIQDISPDKPPAAAAAASKSSVSSQETAADQKEQQGLELIDRGQMDEGLALLREAVRMDSAANRHLNLGSILMGNGVSLQKQGKAGEAAKIFHEAESEIQEAIKKFDAQEETMFISEAYNMLGAIYANGLSDQAKAKAFYKKSLSFYDNPAAQRGLQNLP